MNSFYKLIVFGETEYGFYNEPKICSSFECACELGSSVLHDDTVYGFVIVKVDHETWEVVHETVRNCDYTVYDSNYGSVYDNNYGSIKVRKGKDLISAV